LKLLYNYSRTSAQFEKNLLHQPHPNQALPHEHIVSPIFDPPGHNRWKKEDLQVAKASVFSQKAERVGLFCLKQFLDTVSNVFILIIQLKQ